MNRATLEWMAAGNDVGRLIALSHDVARAFSQHIQSVASRSRDPRTALYILGPWAPTRAAAVRVTYSDGTEAECSARDTATGEWILYLPTGETLVTSVSRGP